MDDEEERTPHGAAHDIKEKGVLDNGQLGQNFRSSPNSLAESPREPLLAETSVLVAKNPQ